MPRVRLARRHLRLPRVGAMTALVADVLRAHRRDGKLPQEVGITPQLPPNKEEEKINKSDPPRGVHPTSCGNSSSPQKTHAIALLKQEFGAKPVEATT